MSAIKLFVEKDQQISDDDDKDRKVVINSLDYDSLAKIIMLLPIPERIDMEKVCTKWREACQLAWYDIKKYKCQTSIGRCYDNRLLTQSYLEEILLRCGKYLKELSLSDICDSSIMPFLGDQCKNLTSLECKFDGNAVIDNANHFVQAFSQLDKLKCIEMIVNYKWYNMIIDLSGIINSLPKEINEIHLSSKFKSLQPRKAFMSFKKFDNLKKLTLHGLCLDNIILQEIAEMATLVHLSIRLLYYIPDWSFLFNKLVNLEYIDLTKGTKYNEARELSTEVLNTIFCTCKNLKHLDMPGGAYDIAEIPRKKWINFQNLEYLGICCDIMPDVADTIVKYCKNLKYLEIYSYSIINNSALKKLTELENLECLILLGSILLTEESIIAISNNCKKLERLEIPRCTTVPSIDGEPLSFTSVLDELSKLQYLEHLNLRYVENLEDSTIIAIANNCKNLKRLDIEGCRAITETALVALTNLKNLQKLKVSCLDIITDSFLIKLNGLEELYCHRCTKLTDAGIIQFIKNNPDLELLDVSCIENITNDMVIAADQATKNRTNGIILHITGCDRLLIEASKSIITSQWLVVK